MAGLLKSMEKSKNYKSKWFKGLDLSDLKEEN